jgi:hypothetical protein
MANGEIKIKFYSDPGHGWAAVKRDLINSLGIADKISYYSYQKGNTVYLEEDCDLSTLITTLKDKGVTVTFDERHTNNRSPIRSYEQFKA